MKVEGKLKEVLKKEAPAAIVTTGKDEPHVVGTWNSYIQLVNDEKLLIPAGGMKETEENLKHGQDVIMLLGSREVPGKSGAGAGYRLSGHASFETQGNDFEKVKSVHPWARAAMVVDVTNYEQLT
ncbi:MAG: pyridoxamine 5'-phosphate oxidase family protein [Firmicutes bacterium]|nr:pyridoxamine 5'-phosphate oxidase family protein [Bacillota bacterium]